MPYLLKSGNKTVLKIDGKSVSSVNGVSVMCGLPPEIDPILANNSWEKIKQVCQAGKAGNYWSVGDTKTDEGTDNYTRTMRICDMQGLYSKHVVFEQVECELDIYAWNSSTNVDGDGAYNDYDIADIRTSLNTTVKGKYSSALQSALTQTTFKVAKNGNSSTILDVTDYLFLPAAKEIYGSQTYSVSEEASALTTYQYYSTNNSNPARVKYRYSVASDWWLRSPESGVSIGVCLVKSTGSSNYATATKTRAIAPCFAW